MSQCVGAAKGGGGEFFFSCSAGFSSFRDFCFATQNKGALPKIRQWSTLRVCSTFVCDPLPHSLRGVLSIMANKGRLARKGTSRSSASAMLKGRDLRS